MQFPGRQAGQGGKVADHEFGLAENPHHVFESSAVDPGFAAHAGIHLGQKGGGHGAVTHAPEVGSGHKPGHIADDAAADAHDHPRTVQTQVQQLPVYRLDRSQGFVFLAQAHGNHRTIRKPVTVEAPDIFIADDHRAAGHDALRQGLPGLPDEDG